MSGVIRICIVGDSRVGKSSLVAEFAGRGLAGSAYSETRGLVTEQFSLGSGIMAEMVDHRSNIPAAEKQSFYKSADFVLLLYDITVHSSFESATSRLYREAHHYAPDAIVMLIGCKMDMNLERAVTIKEAETFATSAGLFFMEVSCKDHTNIELTLKIMRIRAQHILRRRSISISSSAAAQSPSASQAASGVQTPRKMDVATSTPPRDSASQSSIPAQRPPAFNSGGVVNLKTLGAGSGEDDIASADAFRAISFGDSGDPLNTSVGSSSNNNNNNNSSGSGSSSRSSSSGINNNNNNNGNNNTGGNAEHLAALQDRYNRLRAELHQLTSPPPSGSGSQSQRESYYSPNISALPRPASVISSSDNALSTFSPPHVKDFTRTADGSLVPIVETALSREGVTPNMMLTSTQVLAELPVHSSVYERNRNVQTSPSRIMRNLAHPVKEPQLFIDINIGDGRVGQIGVREGDNAYTLAETFVRAFRLEKSFVRKLAALIQTRVQEFNLEQKRQLGRPMSARAETKKQPVDVKPFKFHTDDRLQNRSEVLLRLHVDVGKGKFGTIAVRKGDDPTMLARNFSQAFAIRGERVAEIESKIREHILNYFIREASDPNSNPAQGPPQVIEATVSLSSLLGESTSSASSGYHHPSASPGYNVGASGSASGAGLGSGQASRATSRHVGPSSQSAKLSNVASHTLFYLDVDIGDGRTGRLKVTDRDAPADLARSFGVQHHLDERAIHKLDSILTRNMREYVKASSKS
eukprot:ANDGO_07632.mRNA.1 Ras-related protein RABA1c